MPLAPAEILAAVAERTGPLPIEDPARPWVLPAERLLEVGAALRDDPRLAFKSLQAITAIDRPSDNRIEVVYLLCSMAHHAAISLKVLCDRADPHVPSVTGLWPGADWHEREAFDLMGVVFDGHPCLRRILNPDDWVGHPLRKDYKKAQPDIPVVPLHKGAAAASQPLGSPLPQGEREKGD